MAAPTDLAPIESSSNYPPNPETRVGHLVEQQRLLVDLIIHEDRHNWQKYYNFLYLNLALIAAIALAIREGSPSVPQIALVLGCCAIGLLSSVGFHRTLRGGIDCLEGHKRQLVMIEVLLSPLGLSEVVGNRDGPPRTLLKWSPTVAGGIWLIAVLFVIYRLYSDFLAIANP